MLAFQCDTYVYTYACIIHLGMQTDTYAEVLYLETCSMASIKNTSFISLEELMLKSSRYCDVAEHHTEGGRKGGNH